ncbi:DUF6551 family protein [Acutalibacter intestini]|uniref:DUF6551 family protein n=1 Tax=Acutalibacter intestini TaxID=3093659 RepID=UPI002AC9428F|nr:DUF6551 family protein [Acutalibacter sp. M00204]
MNGTVTQEKLYREMYIDSSELLIPRDLYQRSLNNGRVRQIAANFDERVANEPKVSARDGGYFVFDGQHTVAARKLLNGGGDLPILCKVYTGLNEKEEALLFAQQTGFASKVYPGAKIRALVFAGEETATAFVKATESAGLRLSFNQTRGKNRIGCVSAAYRQFQSLGGEIYAEALAVIASAWKGHKDSLRTESIQGVTGFVGMYHDEYDPKRLASRCRKFDPMHITRSANAAGDALPVPQKYVFEVWKIYNGSSRTHALSLKL